LGALLYDSLQKKILPLPDASLVYPAHGAGSLCGKAISKETVSTIGEQRKLNYALQPMSKQAFIELVTADQPEAPPYFVYDAVLNSKERATLDEALQRELKPLELVGVLELQSAGAQLLDTREPEEFASAHLAGSTNIGLSGQYATWAGTILRREKPIVIIANPGRETESAVRLGRIGFDNVAGYLKDGMRSLESRADLTKTSERYSPPLAAELLESTRAPQLVDVRTPREREEKSIEGSVGIPLNHLVEHANELDKQRAVLVYCAGGYRSSIAASLLEQEGFSSVAEIAGGLAAWELAHLPVQAQTKRA
jgi:rhodanese-related sulfurtransferase